MADRVIIKKYENRRLYDTSASRYINLDDIAQLIRRGADVQVVDAGTGEDLTRTVLTQIIVEDARGRESGLSLDFLRQMVIASGRAGQEGVAASLRAMSQMYQEAYGGLAGGLNPFDFMSRFLPGAHSAAAAKSTKSAKPARAKPAADANDKDEDELNELRRRLDELEQKLGRKRPRRPRRKKA